MFGLFIRERLLLALGTYLWPLGASLGAYGLFYWSVDQNEVGIQFDWLFWRVLLDWSQWHQLSFLSMALLVLFSGILIYMLWTRPLLRGIWVIWWIAHFSPLQQRVATGILGVVAVIVILPLLFDLRHPEKRLVMKKAIDECWETFLTNFQSFKLFSTKPRLWPKKVFHFGVNYGKRWMKDYYTYWQEQRRR
ncbi:MAG: hypothetical protein Q4A67_03325 [Aerococcus sp.]|nr:hypothetical protein [Aerococcus sp.]